MSSNDPDKIRAEIDQTRSQLSQNVDALSEAVTPGNIAKRQAEKVTGAAVGLKDKIMGSAQDAGDSVGNAVSRSVNDAGDNLGSRVADTQAAARRQTRGNPMAAGLIALGAGWLLGSLMPSSEGERQAATSLKEQAAPLMEEAQSVAKEAASNLQEPAQQAAESLKETATAAAQSVKDQAQSAGEQVKATAQDSADTVKEHNDRSDTSLT